MAISAVLRSRTAAAHAQVERSAYLTALASGRVTPEQVTALLARLVPAYDALEAAAGRWAEDERVGRFVLPALHRSERLRADLAHLGGTVDVASPAAQAYGLRVAQAATTAAGFVAHHYTRYVGDLSGGQQIRVALERSLGLVDGAGASCFAFPGVPHDLVPQYRHWLDETPFSAVEREQLVDEVLVAYRHNAAVVAELEAP